MELVAVVAAATRCTGEYLWWQIRCVGWRSHAVAARLFEVRHPTSTDGRMMYMDEIRLLRTPNGTIDQTLRFTLRNLP